MQGAQKISDEKRGNPKKGKGLKRPPTKNRQPQKIYGAQKTSNKKRGNPKKHKGLKRPPMKKEATLKNARSSKNLCRAKKKTPSSNQKFQDHQITEGSHR
jgi:hypothetical protein